MKKTIALLAIAGLGFGAAAPVFAQMGKPTDTVKMKKSRKKLVKKKQRDTTAKKL
ncbi:MAG TPA: hypothetical protein VHE59_08070 [Mucilaginibacter sp.]|nr:hypothetical protein [Mucilaginibacter sp.]